MAKHELFKKFAHEDLQRFNEGRPCLSSCVALSQFDKAKLLLEKKQRGEYTHLKSSDAWSKRLKTLKVSELEELYDAVRMKEPCEHHDAPETMDVCDELAHTRDATNEAENRNAVDLANATLPDHPAEDEEHVSSWYQSQVKMLTTRHLRPEQFRRKRAELRAEYWKKMDLIRNNATPTVVNA